MSYILASRITARRLFGFPTNQLLYGFGSRAGSKAAKSAVPPCVQQIMERPGETLDDKNARLGRPLSPHLTIYKWAITNTLSIFHRLTGVAAGVYLMAFAAYAYTDVYDFNQLSDYVDCLELPNYVIWLCRSVIAFPFVYHTCNGIRHLVWDTATFLSMKQITQTGIGMLTLVTICMGLVVFAL